MKKNVLKTIVLFFVASILPTLTWAIPRNQAIQGAATSIQTETDYYLFNLGTSMYFGVEYEWTARGAVIKNPLQKVQFLNAQTAGFYNIKSTAGNQIDKFVFNANDHEGWGDRADQEGESGKDTYWAITSKSAGVYQLHNRSVEDNMFLGPISTTDRRLKTDLAANNANSDWVFILASSADLELLNVKEALLFSKINEVEQIAGFSSSLISEATAVYTNSASTLAQVKAVLAKLAAAQYDFGGATTNNPVDGTVLIVNPTIIQTAGNNDARPFGWESSNNFDGPNHFFVKESGTNTVLEAWGYDYSASSVFDYNQTIYGVPNGIYKLSVLCYTEANESSENPNGNAGLYIATSGNDMYKGVTNLGAHTISSDLVEVTDNTLKIGVRKNGELNFRYFTADNFVLTYYGEASPVYSVDKADMAFSKQNNIVKFNISAANLTSDITISSAVQGILVSPSVVSAATANSGSVEVTVTFDLEATGATSALGLLTLTNAEAGNKTIEVLTSKEEAFVPKANSGNLISDPTVSDMSKFGGWGPKTIVSIKDEPGAIKSGAYCGKITEEGAGSLDAKIVHALEPNTDYSMFAWVKTNGTFNFAVTGSTVGAGGSDVGYVVPDTEGSWMAVELNFQTGADPTGTIAYFNNWGFTGTYGYIDNWELYKKTDITVSIPETELAPALSILAVKGGIRVFSEKPQSVRIFTTAGVLVKQVMVDASEVEINLSAGIYIVEGQKVIVF